MESSRESNPSVAGVYGPSIDELGQWLTEKSPTHYPPQTMFPVTVHLLVKANSQIEADVIVTGRLNNWFLEQTQVPFPNGTLMLWRQQR